MIDGLRDAIGRSLDDLLQALRLEPLGEDRFHVDAPEGHLFERTYGGHLLAQAVMAAGATVDPAHAVHSLHATFVKAGVATKGVDLEVTRVRDGR